MRRVTILGSTGSIGCNTVDLIANAPGEYDVVAVTGGHNIARLAEQARRLDASVAVTAHDDCLEDLRSALQGTDIECAAGRVALCEAAARPADWSMSAIVGAAGLAPGLEAVKSGGTLALGEQGKPCLRGSVAPGTGRASGRTHPAGGQRAFGGVPSSHWGGDRRGRACGHHGVGWRVPRLADRTPQDRYCREQASCASQLGHGYPDNNRLREPVQQGAWSSLKHMNISDLSPIRIEAVVSTLNP